MRLTLRTLLAYLDGTLDADQARGIAQKIAESDVAPKLIDRIQEVTHNSQLPAPQLAGPGAKVDANVIAEYLDSVLENDKLAKLEEILLKSDVLLAEAAASHQILTRHLAQPAAVSPELHARMLDLEPRGKKKVRVPAVPQDEDDDDDAEDEDNESEEDLEIGAPLKVRPRTVPLLPALLLLALVGGLGYWILQMVTRPPAETTLVSGDTATADGDTATAGEGTPKVETPAPKTGEPGKTETPPAPKEPEPPRKPAEPAPAEPVNKEAIDQLPDNRPSSERRPVGKVLAPAAMQPAVVLRRDPTGGPWQRLQPGDRIVTGEPLLSLPGYRSKVELDGGVELTLFGQLQEFSTELDPMLDSCVVLHVPPAGYDADLTLQRGRIVLRNVKQKAPAQVRVRFVGEIWELTLHDDQSVTSVELLGYYPPDVPFRATPGVSDGPLFLATAYGLKGQTHLKVRYQTFGLPVPSIFQWNNRSGPAAGPQACQLPPWFAETAAPAAAREFRAALADLEQRLANKPVEVALLEMRKQASPAARMVAVRGLAAIDALGELLEALSDDKDPVSRGQAILVLRMWIARSADNEFVLYRLLGDKGYTPAQAETIMELLHAFSLDAARNPATYEKLIANLGHDKLAIRQLSYYHLAHLVPDWQMIPYDPAGAPAQLEEGVRLWKKLIPDGQLPPKRQ